jgi:hypothetical protein
VSGRSANDGHARSANKAYPRSATAHPSRASSGQGGPSPRDVPPSSRRSPPHVSPDRARSLLASLLFTLLSLSLFPAPLPAQSPETRAFLEVAVPREIVYVGEVVPVTLRIGFDAAWFQSHAVRLFRRPTDLAAQVVAPWFPALPGTLPFDPASRPTAPALTFGLNDDVVAAPRAPDDARFGTTYSVVELVRPIRLSAPGPFEIPEASLKFAYATRFTTDFVGNRTPADRLDAEVRSRKLTLRALPPPEIGRPAAFTGAVGRFTVRAESDRAEVAAGGSLRVRLTIEGDGDLAAFSAPKLPADRAYYVLGTLDERTPTARTFLFDVSIVDSALRAIPPIPFAFFDPNARAYSLVSTAPVPITVRADAASPAAASSRRTPNDVVDAGLRDLKPVERRPTFTFPPPSPEILILLLALPWLVAATVVARRFARARAAQDGGAAKAKKAADHFRRAVKHDPSTADRAFFEYLAARLRITPAEVFEPDLAARLSAAGVPHDLAAQTHRAVESALSARYGGPPTSDAAPSLTAVVDALESAFRAV